MVGGLCCFINECWCNKYTVKRIICTPEKEPITVWNETVLRNHVAALNVLSGTPFMTRATLFLN